jgi:hypothetical protein
MEIELGGMDWTHLAQDIAQWSALANKAINLWDPQNTGEFLSS